MGQPKKPKPVKLVASVIVASENVLPGVLRDMKSDYGETDFVSPWMAFDFTDYYAPEMGEGLKRRVLAFQELLPPDTLPSVKHRTNEIEQKYRREARRLANIDPGYVCGEHMILATSKAYAHRPYLRDGIYADLTLIFRKGSFRPLEWTYPDYRQPEMVEIFDAIRRTYLFQLRERTAAESLSEREQTWRA